MFDREQIIKAWECCGSTTYRCDECPIDQQKKDDCICGGYLAQCTLALYRELTKENEGLKAENERAHQAYYEIACEVADLRDENERFRVAADVSDTTLTNALRIVNEFCDKRIMRAKADTVRRMQERLKEAFERHPSSCGDCIKRTVDQIAKEILEETK